VVQSTSGHAASVVAVPAHRCDPVPQETSCKDQAGRPRGEVSCGVRPLLRPDAGGGICRGFIATHCPCLRYCPCLCCFCCCVWWRWRWRWR
jgi:hypothetical protein